MKKHLAVGFGDTKACRMEMRDLLEWSYLDDVISLESNLLLLGDEIFQICYFVMLCLCTAALATLFIMVLSGMICF